MADGTSDVVENATLEGAAAAWLAERAEELDVTPAELLERLVAAYRAAEAGDGPDVVTETEFEERLAALESDLQSESSEVPDDAAADLADLQADLADLQADLADLQSDVADLESDVAAANSDFTEKLQDVRDRVIQVKREADAKAPADHDHPDLAEQTADALDALDDLEAEFTDLADAHRRLSSRVDAGFENFEEVLTYLRDQTDDLDRKLTTLATAVLAMRESVASVAAVHTRRERTDSLKRAANRERVQVADCEDCDSEITVSLLTAPECPYCNSTFEDVEANRGWFGSHTLVTGSAPALTAGESDLGDDEAWLGADTATLEEMASDDPDGDDGPEIVEPSEIEDPADEAGEDADDARRVRDDRADASDAMDAVDVGDETRGDDTTHLDETDMEIDAHDLDLGDEDFDLDDGELDLDDTEFDFGGAPDGDVPDDGETDA